MADHEDQSRPEAEDVPGGPVPPSEASSTRPRLAWARLSVAVRPRLTKTQGLVGLLCAALGFGIVTQVAATSSDDFLRTARTPDLIRLLDDLGERHTRLDDEASRLEEARTELLSGADRGAAALAESRRRAEALGVLTGTVEATGEGVEVRVVDPEGGIEAAALLDTVQELRDAGAEAIQIGPVRVVASTSFLDAPDGEGVLVDGVEVDPPFRIRAVGSAATMAAALGIPGGVVDTVSKAGGSVDIDQRDRVVVDALRELESPRYARPAE